MQTIIIKPPVVKRQRSKRRSPKQPIRPNIKLMQPKVRGKHLAEFTRQLATLVQARLPLLRALEVLTTQCRQPEFQKILQNILTKVEDGAPLSDSIEHYPKIFSKFYISLIRVGEQGGILGQTLNRCATYLEQIARLQRKLLTAMAYPAVIVLVAVGAIGFMLAVVVPTFADMFRDFGGEMPGPTKVLLASSQFVQNNALLLLLGTILLTVAFFQGKKTQIGKRTLDRIQLKIPVLSMFASKSFLARFCRTLGTLLTSGVPLLRSLEVAETITENHILKNAILVMKTRVVQGQSMLPSDKAIFPFTDLTTQMIHVGEETGELSRMLLDVAAFYEEELDAAIDTMTSVIEPVIIVFLGLFLGGVLIAMYMQLFNLVNVIQ